MMTLLSPHNKSKNYKSVTHKLDEENLILKKAIAIFTPHSDND